MRGGNDREPQSLVDRSRFRADSESNVFGRLKAARSKSLLRSEDRCALWNIRVTESVVAICTEVLMNTGRSTATISSNHAAPSHTPVDFGRPFRQVYRKSTDRKSTR